jgi:hypothetical protein
MQDSLSRKVGHVVVLLKSYRKKNMRGEYQVFKRYNISSFGEVE